MDDGNAKTPIEASTILLPVKSDTKIVGAIIIFALLVFLGILLYRDYARDKLQASDVTVARLDERIKAIEGSDVAKRHYSDSLIAENKVLKQTIAKQAQSINLILSKYDPLRRNTAHLGIDSSMLFLAKELTK